MRKRITSLFLVLALCLTLLPTAALATENTTEPSTQLTEPTPVPQEPETPGQGENTKTPDQPEEPPQDEEPPAAEEVAPDREVSETADSPHTHPICGETCTDGKHTGDSNILSWTGISKLDEIAGDGNYYLTGDVAPTGPWMCNYNVALCLNGYSIKAEYSSTSVTVAKGKTFTLTDCNGSKSFKKFSKNDNGRWVQDDNGPLTVNGGAVFHQSSKGGTGVDVSNTGTFTMYGGTICGNSGGYYGGGVSVNGTFHMSGGTICGNVGYSGSGVGVNGTFNMSGSAAITGNGINGINNNGGGVYVSNKDAKMNVSGDVKIENNWKGGTLDADTGLYEKGNGSANNLCLVTDGIVTIDDSKGLNSTAYIGITTVQKPLNGRNVQIASGAKRDVDYTQIFIPDEGYTVSRPRLSYLYLELHQHSWGYTASGATITAKCSICSASGGSVTINKPAHTTYGDGQSERATLTENSWQGLTASKITITYTKGSTSLEAAPTDAGTYTASITVGGQTASVVYTIQRADPKASDFTFQAPASGNLTYDGTPKTATVTSTKNGMGAVTVKYFKNGAETEPKDAGDYTVKVSVAEGANYNAADDLKIGELTISKGTLDEGANKEATIRYSDTGVKTYTHTDFGFSEAGTFALNGSVTEGTNLLASGYPKFENDGVQVQLATGLSPNGGEKKVVIPMTFTPTGGNYKPKEVTLTITLADKATDTKTMIVTQKDFVYGEEKVNPQVTGVGGTPTFTYKERDKVGAVESDTAPTNAGKYTVTAKIDTADTIYTASADFEIVAKPISGATVDAITGLAYNGTAHTPTPAVKMGSTTLANATDYTLSYSKNTNAGTATMTVTGRGNYTGTETVNFDIGQATLTVTPTGGQSKKFGATDPTLTYTTSGAVGSQIPSFTGKLSREAGEDVGQYDITKGSLELKDSDTFKAANYNLVLDTAVVTFEITKGTYGGSAPTKTVNILKNYAGVQTGKLTAADFFTTAPAEAKITNAVPNFKPSSMMSLAGADSSGNFTYDSKANITAASDESWTVTISSKNYTDITTAELIFKPVDKTDVNAQITFPNGTLTYNSAGQKYEKATISGVSGGTWNYTYVANSGTGASLDSAGLPKTAGTYTVTAKYEDDAHIGTKNATLTVSKATPTGAPTCTKITTSGKKLSDAPLAIGTIAPAGGTLAWDMAANTVVAANTAYGWTYTPADTANYKALTGSLTPYAVSSGGGGGSSAATPSVSDRIARELKNAKEGSTVTIDMKGETKLPASVTKEIAGKDVTVELDMGGGMVWSFNGLDVPKGGVRLDLGVKTGTKTIPAKVINALTGETTTIQLQLDHNGPFGMSLKLSVDLDKKHDGLYANLYFYNPKSGELEFQSAGLISGGKASWVFDHASDYAIVIDKESHEPMTFTDVPDTAYYAEAVNWAVAKKITEGVGNDLFGSNDPCTRAQIVTFLWRAAGSPGPKTMSGFSDVPADSYYAKAVAWAVENGITGGTGDGKFSPDATCTRAQAVTFLYRASGAPAVSGNAAFSDVATNAYYAAAVKWAEKNGITGGIGGGLFGSDNNCTRAQIVTFLYRSCNRILTLQ